MEQYLERAGRGARIEEMTCRCLGWSEEKGRRISLSCTPLRHHQEITDLQPIVLERSSSSPGPLSRQIQAVIKIMQVAWDFMWESKKGMKDAFPSKNTLSLQMLVDKLYQVAKRKSWEKSHCVYISPWQRWIHSSVQLVVTEYTMF